MYREPLIAGNIVRILLTALLSVMSFSSRADALALNVEQILPKEGSPEPKLVSAGVIELGAPFSTNRNSRVKWDVALTCNLKRMSGISFDFMSRDNEPVSSFSLYFNCSGGGCYSTSFVPGRSGEWKRVVIDKSLARRIEGHPAGWDKVSSFTIAAWRGGTNDTSFLLSNLEAYGLDPEVVVVRGNYAMKQMPRENPVNFHKFTEGMTKIIRDCGVTASAVPDYDLDDEQLIGAKLVVLPFNPYVPDKSVSALRRFCENGGKVFACYLLAKGVDEVLGVKRDHYYVAAKHPENPPFVGFCRTALSVPEQPQFFPDNDADGLVVLAETDGCEVLGRWAGADHKPSPVPAFVRTARGYHYGGAWSTYGSPGRAMMRAILGDVNPAWKTGFADAERRACDSERRQANWFASQPAKKGEWRAICCTWSFCSRIDRGNSPFGSWDNAIRFLKDNGLNGVLPNYAYADVEHNPDKCMEACRKYDVECHLWKICWEAHEGFPKGFKGRTVVTFKGKSEPMFMCPSDPLNLAAETEMFVRLAHLNPTGIHLDYIRYMDKDQCFCSGCRAAFEKRIGRKLDNWPEDVRKSPRLEKEWDAFRCDNITALVRTVSKRVRSECPGVRISASVFHTNEGAPHGVGQDWGAWCREGLLDFVCPMDYYISNHFAFKGLVRSHFGYFRDSTAKLHPGIGITCWQSTLDDKENLIEQIKAVRALGLDGFYIFDYSFRAVCALPALRMGLTAE